MMITIIAKKKTYLLLISFIFSIKMEKIEKNAIYFKLKNTGIYYRYIDYLFGIYREINSRRAKLSHNLTPKPIVVFGDVLYYLLYREAENYNLLTTIPEDIRKQFWKYKAIDIDIKSFFLKWYDDPKDFMKSAESVKSNYLMIMKDIDSVHPEYLNIILSILNLSRDSINLEFSSTENADGSLQHEAQLSVSLNHFTHKHILDLHLIANFEEFETSKFKFSTGEFIGENLIGLLTRQLYPTEGAWRTIDTKNLEKDEIYSEMSCILKQNKLDNMKFKQGGVRAKIARHIFAQSLENSVSHIEKIFIPHNKFLANKILFFSSKLIRKLCSGELINRALKLHEEVNSFLHVRASPKHTLEFIDLCLIMWQEFMDNIQLNNCVYIVHFTSSAAFKSISSSGWLLTQPDRYKQNLFFSFEGSGNGTRRIGPNNLSIKQQTLGIYDEGLGIYFRILQNKPERKDGVVAIVFSPNILAKYSGWFINTEENFGFILGNDIVKAPFSGEYGRTIYDIRSKEISNRSELVIPHSVNISDAIDIIQ